MAASSRCPGRTGRKGVRMRADLPIMPACVGPGIDAAMVAFDLWRVRGGRHSHVRACAALSQARCRRFALLPGSDYNPGAMDEPRPPMTAQTGRQAPLVRLIVTTVDLCRRYAVMVVLAGIALGVGLGIYAAGHLGINANTSNLIGEHASWRALDDAMDEAFPQNSIGWSSSSMRRRPTRRTARRRRWPSGSGASPPCSRPCAGRPATRSSRRTACSICPRRGRRHDQPAHPRPAAARRAGRRPDLARPVQRARLGAGRRRRRRTRRSPTSTGRSMRWPTRSRRRSRAGRGRSRGRRS